MTTERALPGPTLLDLPVEILCEILSKAYRGLTGESYPNHWDPARWDAFSRRIAIENSCRSLREISSGLSWGRGAAMRKEKGDALSLSAALLWRLMWRPGLQPKTEDPRRFADLFFGPAWRFRGFSSIHLYAPIAKQFNFVRNFGAPLAKRFYDAKRAAAEGLSTELCVVDAVKLHFFDQNLSDLFVEPLVVRKLELSLRMGERRSWTRDHIIHVAGNLASRLETFILTFEHMPSWGLNEPEANLVKDCLVQLCNSTLGIHASTHGRRSNYANNFRGIYHCIVYRQYRTKVSRRDNRPAADQVVRPRCSICPSKIIKCDGTN